MYLLNTVCLEDLFLNKGCGSEAGLFLCYKPFLSATGRSLISVGVYNDIGMKIKFFPSVFTVVSQN
jgi:hypothetical protein